MLLQFLINVFSSNFDEFISVMARNESTGKGGTFHRFSTISIIVMGIKYFGLLSETK